MGIVNRRDKSRLNETISEKDILLRELHHRVKNNLQKIVSIVNLQVYEESDPRIVDILKGIQTRIYSMSLVHEKLYRSSELARLPIREYLTSLALGLLMNELISNSMKYAFSGKSRGTISVVLARTEKGEVELSIRDDGRGLPQKFDPYASDSLGMQIVTVLVDQLKGRLAYRDEGGACFTVIFPLRR